MRSPKDPCSIVSKAKYICMSVYDQLKKRKSLKMRLIRYTQESEDAYVKTINAQWSEDVL